MERATLYEVALVQFVAKKKDYTRRLRLSMSLGGATSRFVPVPFVDPTVAPEVPAWWCATRMCVQALGTKHPTVCDLQSIKRILKVEPQDSHGHQQFCLRLEKALDGERTPRVYPRRVAISTNSTTKHTVVFGETAELTLCVRRLTAEEQNALPAALEAETTEGDLQQEDWGSLAGAAADVSKLTHEAAESGFQPFLREWGGVLGEIGDTVAALIESLPFGGLLVNAAAGLFRAVCGRGAVLELGTQICGQTVLMLRVLSQPAVCEGIRADPSTSELLRQLATTLEEAVAILRKYVDAFAVTQLVCASARLEALEEKSVAMTRIFAMLHHLTTLRVQAAQGDVLERILVAANATKTLTADGLVTVMLPTLSNCIAESQQIVADNLVAKVGQERTEALALLRRQLQDDVLGIVERTVNRSIDAHVQPLAAASEEQHAALTSAVAQLREATDGNGSTLSSTLTELRRLDANMQPLVSNTAMAQERSQRIEDLCQRCYTILCNVETFRTMWVRRMEEQQEVLDKLSTGQVAVLDAVTSLPEGMRSVLAHEVQQLQQQLVIHDARDRAHMLRVVQRSVAGLYKQLSRRDAFRLMVSNRQVQAVETSEARVVEAVHSEADRVIRELAPGGSPRRLVFDAATDANALLSATERRRCVAYPLDVLQGDLRILYSNLFRDNPSVVDDSIDNLDRTTMYTNLQIVSTPTSLAQRTDATDAYDGGVLDSTNVIATMQEAGWRTLLVEGRAGIGKTTWGIHLAQLQNFAEGVIVLVKLSDLAQYLRHVAYTEDHSLSARELMYVSFGQRPEHVPLINTVFFGGSDGGRRKITWVLDGLDEVVQERHGYMKVVREALNAAVTNSGGGSARAAAAGDAVLFDREDRVIVTSREERGSDLNGAQYVATINPWSVDDAREFIRRYFRQRAVRMHLEDNGDVWERCQEEALGTLQMGTMGSFSTLPIVLEMLCWCSAGNRALAQNSNGSWRRNIADLYKTSISKIYSIAVKKQHPEVMSSEKDVAQLCMAKAMEAAKTGSVFFALDNNSACERDLYRSRLVRRVSEFAGKLTVRFAHKSFLEYFLAMHFANAGCNALLDCPKVDCAVACKYTPTMVEFISFASLDDMVRISSDAAMTVSIELHAHRECALEVVWLSGDEEVREFTNRRSHSPHNAVSGRWDSKGPYNRKCVSIEAQQTHALVVRHATGSQEIIAVHCRVSPQPSEEGSGGEPAPPASLLKVTCRQPMVDIPSHRQHRNFFHFLGELVRERSVDRSAFLDYLFDRLSYHHARTLRLMPRNSRSLAIKDVAADCPTLLGVQVDAFPSDAIAFYGDGRSKAQRVASMGLSLVVELFVRIADCSDSIVDRLNRVQESTTIGGRVAEAIGVRKRVIFEWAVVPCAAFGTKERLESVEKQLLQLGKLAQLRQGPLYREALVTSYLHNNIETTRHMEANGVSLDMLVACRLGAKDIVDQELQKHSHTDATVLRAFDVSLDALQLETASLLWSDIHTNRSTLYTAAAHSALSRAVAAVPTALAIRRWLGMHMQFIRCFADAQDQLLSATVHRVAMQYIDVGCAPWVHRDLIITASELAQHDKHGRFNDRLVEWLCSTPDVGNIEELDLSNCRTLTDSGVRHVTRLTALTSLDLAGTNVSDVGLEYLQGIASLKALNLSSSRIRDTELKHWKGHTALTTLDLSRTSIGNAELEHLKALMALTSLDLSHTITSDVGLKHLRGLTRLTTLNLSSTSIISTGLEHLKGLTRLTTLDLSSTSISDAGLEHLKGLTRLTTFTLSSTMITSTGLEHLKGLTKLTTLNLPFTRVGDAGLEHLKGLTRLTTLNLPSTKIGDAGLEHLKGLTRLTTLNLSSTSIGDAGLEHLKPLTALATLDLSRTIVSASGVEHLKGLTALTTLNLSTFWIGDAGLEHLKPLAALTSLNLGLTRISGAGLEHLKGLAALETLSLGLTRISAAGLEHLKGLASLTALNLQSTSIADAEWELVEPPTAVTTLELPRTRISDVGVEHLKPLTALTTLNLSNTHVSSAGLEHLKTLMALKELDVSKTSIADAGLEHLTTLMALTSLDVSSTSVGDTGLEHLKGLTALTALDVSNTSVSNTGLEHLKGLMGLATLNLTGTSTSRAGLSHLKGPMALRVVFRGNAERYPCCEVPCTALLT